MRLLDKLILIGIILILAGSIATLLTQDFKLGLDLDGGAHLVYQADFSQLAEDQNEDDAMEGIVKVIERRVNTYGVSEPLIEEMGDGRVLVQLPGIDDIEEAKSRLLRVLDRPLDDGDSKAHQWRERINGLLEELEREN